MRLLQLLSQGALCALFLLLPLLFSPWTLDAFEPIKYTLFVVLTGITVISWLGGMVLSRRFAFRASWLHFVPLAFVIAVIASTVFSLSLYQTWVGGNGQEYTSTLALVSYVLLYFASANIGGTSEMQKRILGCLLLSASLSGLVTLLGLLNVVHLPFIVSQAQAFSTFGPVNSFAVFLLITMFLGHALWLVLPLINGKPLFQGKSGVAMRGMIIFLTLVTLFVLLAVDFWVLWVLCILGVLLLIGFGFIQAKEFPQPGRFVLPFLVLVVSVIFLFFPTPLRVGIPILVSPSYGTSWDIARQAMGTSVQRLLLGTGPGTYIIDYAVYKPQAVNNTVFWNILFDRSKSQVVTMLATLGVIGTALWALFVLLLGLKALGRLVLERDHEEWKMTYVIFVGWCLLVASSILYSSTLTLSVLLWAFSGLLASQVFTRWREADFSKAPRAGLLTSFAFVVLSVVMLGGVFLVGQYFVGETVMAKAVKLDQTEGATVEGVANKAIQAAQVNPFMDAYARSVSTAMLARAVEVINASNSKPSQEQLQQISTFVSAAVNSSVRATQLGPFNVANWVMRGTVYLEVMPFAQNAEDYAAASFQQAVALEPANPAYVTDLGRVYLAVAERARALKSSDNKDLADQAKTAEGDMLAKAEETFQKAIDLKPDYAPAHYYLAATFEREGKLEDATTRLAALTRAQPLNIGLGLQLGLLYIRQEKWDEAQTELERIVGVNPEYSNALWYLSAVYEKQGDDDKALETAQKVLELNPDNEAVKTRVDQLKSGGASDEIPEPVDEGTSDTSVTEEP